MTGGKGGSAGAGGAGSVGGTGGAGRSGGGGGGAFGPGGAGGNGGNGGPGGSGGGGGNPGHAGNGGNGEGGDVYVAGGSCRNGASMPGGNAQGGKGGAAAPVGAGRAGAAGGPAGRAGKGGSGSPTGADGEPGKAGGAGQSGASGLRNAPGADGTGSYNTSNVSSGSSSPTSSVSPLPQSVTSPFSVNWSGNDPGGPAISSFTVSVSTNGGPFKVWLSKSTKTSAEFTGVPGDTYAFYSVATDKSGRVQSTPSSAQASTIVVSTAHSTLQLTSSIVSSGELTTITLQAMGIAGAPIAVGGLTVAFELASPRGGQGHFSFVTDLGNGKYTATFEGSLAGGNSIVATLDGQKATAVAPITVTSGLASPATSSISLPANKVAAGSSVTVTLQARDAAGNKETTGGLSVVFELAGGEGKGTFSTATDKGNGTYAATFAGSVAGANAITATIGGQSLTTASPKVTIVPGAASPATSQVSASSTLVQAGSAITLTLQAIDADENKETSGGLRVAFELVSAAGARGVFGAVRDDKNGAYTATFIGTTAGSNSIAATIGGKLVAATAPIVVTPGPVSLVKSIVTLSAAKVAIGDAVAVTLQAKDAYGNYETAGGLIVAFALASAKGGQGTISAVTDNSNGTYTATFKATAAGTNEIIAEIGSKKLSSKPASITVL